MSDTDLNNDPSTKVQQYPGKTAFLIDCDGGLGTAFHPKSKPVIEPELIKSFPSNSDIFLFYNINDHNIVERMENLKRDNSNVYLYPNINRNSKNGADMNLSFKLGTISEKYGAYFIFAGPDKGYKEITDRLKKENSYLKYHVELRQFKNPGELAQYMDELNRAQNENQDELNLSRAQNKSATTSSHTVKFTPENLFHHCPFESWQQSSRLYRLAELVDHLDHKHPEFCYHYYPICEEMVQENNWSPDRSSQFENHCQEDHLDNEAGFSLDIWPVE